MAHYNQSGENDNQRVNFREWEADIRSRLDSIDAAVRTLPAARQRLSVPDLIE